MIGYKFRCYSTSPSITPEDTKLLSDVDGIRIAFIKSNYGEFYHENFVYLSKEYIEEERKTKKKSNKGRKRKPDAVKNRRNEVKFVDMKGNKREIEAFYNSILFGVIYQDAKGNTKTSKVLLFQKKKDYIQGIISMFTESEHLSVEGLVNILLGYIKEKLPEQNLTYESYDFTLINKYKEIPLPKSPYESKVIAFNLYNLNKYLQEYKNNFMSGAVKVDLSYNNSKSVKVIYTIFDSDPDSITSIKIRPNGKISFINVFTPSEGERLYNAFIRILHDICIHHASDIVQFSIPSRKGKDMPKYVEPIVHKIVYCNENIVKLVEINVDEADEID